MPGRGQLGLAVVWPLTPQLWGWDALPLQSIRAQWHGPRQITTPCRSSNVPVPLGSMQVQLAVCRCGSFMAAPADSAE